jgi:hypothetical protein
MNKVLYTEDEILPIHPRTRQDSNSQSQQVRERSQTHALTIAGDSKNHEAPHNAIISSLVLLPHSSFNARN